jgi:hypothetical protein
MNDKMYIHEHIDIIGPNRAQYMQHMTANWCPIAKEERNQSCYGVWGVIGSTRHWPEVINLWEEDGYDGLAKSFRHETSHPGHQNPKLAKWWPEAAKYRSGGITHRLEPAPWTRTIAELCADGVRGEGYCHDYIKVTQGSAHEFLERVAERAEPAYGRFGWILAGAWTTAMGNESECWLLWAMPTWEQWAEAEKARRADRNLMDWWSESYRYTTDVVRYLLVDSPLSPMRIGRQPTRADRDPNWTE